MQIHLVFVCGVFVLCLSGCSLFVCGFGLGNFVFVDFVFHWWCFCWLWSVSWCSFVVVFLFLSVNHIWASSLTSPGTGTQKLDITLFNHLFSITIFPNRFFAFAVFCNHLFSTIIFASLRSSLLLCDHLCFFAIIFASLRSSLQSLFSNHSFQSVFELMRINLVFWCFWVVFWWCCSFFVCGFRLGCFYFVFVILAFFGGVFCRVGCDLFRGVVVVFNVSFLSGGLSGVLCGLWCLVCESHLCSLPICESHLCSFSLSSPETWNLKSILWIIFRSFSNHSIFAITFFQSLFFCDHSFCAITLFEKRFEKCLTKD